MAIINRKKLYKKYGKYPSLDYQKNTVYLMMWDLPRYAKNTISHV